MFTVVEEQQSKTNIYKLRKLRKVLDIPIILAQNFWVWIDWDIWSKIPYCLIFHEALYIIFYSTTCYKIGCIWIIKGNMLYTDPIVKQEMHLSL